ncbi:type IV secretory system conjugative DNA transfer family protein [Methylobacterium sp. BTF04]|uniref:type IV secretory system conjugative DNA transfer family protein n=1 Tax=Methylobacterium sp. BTF04 TaxID=2708300 RepID=UPI0013D349E8|nr:type IV secretory system conjugative DNA transfer family protein [Methylobacterium sp. BTF04]NEU14593.1 type IV secretory system conjugative DNA transfer family protein [Methylobacterium sp. BTF04]
MRHVKLGRLSVCIAIIILASLAVGYPAAFIATHGIDPIGWPAVPGTPGAWFSPEGATIAEKGAFFVQQAGKTYLNMLLSRSAGLPGGGRLSMALIVAAAAMAITIVLMSGKLVPLRHRSKRYGDAKWAGPKDFATMRKGLELGIDPDTGRTVRIQVEGNLVTIAPPRSGKTSGLILPNLILPEFGAWAGPVVVVDPKGDVVRAVRRRREVLGRKVRCIDPVGIASGHDRWNPLLNRKAGDVLYLQSMARALLPDRVQSSDGGEFFKDRAVSVVVAALSVSIREGRNDVIEAAELIRDPERLLAALDGRTDAASRDAIGILNSSDDRSRGAILATAAQVFSWALDERMQKVVTEHTFELSDLCRGDTDLYIVLPADKRRDILAPFVRWLLADLFAAVRDTRASQRIVTIIDEAAVLGSFDAILRGVGELPGYGMSLWTFWQARSQIEEHYGRTGTDTIIGTAEALMLFNLSAAQGEERQYWSDTFGTYTGVDPRPGRNGGPDILDVPVAVALVPPSELAALTQDHSIVFLNSSRYTTDPLKLRKTKYDDLRFTGLLDGQEPVGPTRS